MIVLPEVLRENSSGHIDLKTAYRDHLFKIGPILRPVEERLEDGKVTAGKERDVGATESLAASAPPNACGIPALSSAAPSWRIFTASDVIAAGTLGR